MLLLIVMASRKDDWSNYGAALKLSRVLGIVASGGGSYRLVV